MRKARTQEIIEYVREHGELSANEATRLFKASLPTIRRDFNNLAEAGEVKRFYGGISRNDDSRDPALPYSMRSEWFSEVKHALVKELATMLPQSGLLFVDGGTTTAHLGLFLKSPALRIITNSLALEQVFARQFPEGDGPELYLTGGKVNRKSAILLGPEAEQMIRHFHADISIISGSALDQNFIYDNRDDAAALQRLMIENSERLIIVCDSSKTGKKAMCKVVESSKIDTLITNFMPEKHETISALIKNGVKVKIIKV